VPVLVHQLQFDLGREGELQALAGVAQGGARQFPERLVIRAVVAGGDQPRVFNLLVAPQHAQVLAVAWKKLFRSHAHAVDIEQRAVGIEEHSLRLLLPGRATFFHRPTLFDTCEAINIKNIQEFGTKSIKSGDKPVPGWSTAGRSSPAAAPDEHEDEGPQAVKKPARLCEPWSGPDAKACGA
jgi:hypothetical protein